MAGGHDRPVPHRGSPLNRLTLWRQRAAVDLIVATAFINILSLALPLAILQVYDRIIPNVALQTFALLIAGVAVALVLELVLRMCRSWLTASLAARFEHRVGCAALSHILDADVAAFERDGAGTQAQRLNALASLREFYGGQPMTLVCDLPFAVIFLAAIAHLAGWLVVAPLTVTVLFAVTATLAGRNLRRALVQRSNADDKRYNFLVESLSGIQTVKSLALEQQMLRRYERLQEASAEAQQAVTRENARAQSIGATFSHVSLAVLVGFGALMVIDGQLTIGGLAACTILSGRALQPLQRAVGMWTRFQTLQVARDQLNAVFTLPLETDARPEARSAPAPQRHTRAPATAGIDVAVRRTPPPLVGRIELVDAGFRYPDAATAILDGVSLAIAAGETIAITGASGSGKTTVLHLLMGLLKLTHGRLLIDGVDISALEPSALRAQIAYLPRRVDLFDGTIADNITMFRPERERDARLVAEFLGLDDIVARLPRGYDTPVGRGIDDPLSDGVRQQIGTARALLTRPRMLLFDEANAALDRLADSRLQAVLSGLHGRTTLVLVTHRPSVLKLADRAFLLGDGRLAQQSKSVTQLAPPAPGPVVPPRTAVAVAAR